MAHRHSPATAEQCLLQLLQRLAEIGGAGDSEYRLVPELQQGIPLASALIPLLPVVVIFVAVIINRRQMPTAGQLTDLIAPG